MRSLGLALCGFYLIKLFGLVFIVLPKLASEPERSQRVLQLWRLSTIPYVALLTGLLVFTKV